MGKYGGVTVLSGFILYNLGFIFQLMAVPSSDWVSSDLTKLPLEIPMPAGGQGSQLDFTCRLAQCLNHEKSKFRFVVKLRVRKEIIGK